MHGSDNVQGVFNYAVCLMAMCVVKQAVYSTELQKVCCSYVPGMVMVSSVTLCNQALFPQQYVSTVNICASAVQFCVTHALCQSAISITIL